ncbi:MAG: hypothetical protein Q9219_001992 [cf. Caloplaca sp. 3 TL-2023]
MTSRTTLADQIREGVADEQLAKLQNDRKRKLEAEDTPHRLGKRSVSVSSRSSVSVSTISTTMSRAPSRERDMHPISVRSRGTRKSSRDGGRRVLRERSMSYTSNSSSSQSRTRALRAKDRNPRLRKPVHSPKLGDRGRSSNRRPSNAVSSSSRKRRRSRSSSMSYMSDSSYAGRQSTGVLGENRRTRARRSSTSPDFRGRDRRSRAPQSNRSRSNSMDRSRIARERRSMTPERASRRYGDREARLRPGVEGGQSRFLNGESHYKSTSRGKEHELYRAAKPRPVSPPRRERSLSPFSKRLALTQAMNMHR